MSWNYRVTRTEQATHADEAPYAYEIREFYYDDEGTIKFWSMNPCAPYGGSLLDLAEDLDQMKEALTHPIIALSEDDDPKELT